VDLWLQEDDGSFVVGSLTSSQASIEASGGGGWHALVAARVLGLSSLRDKIQSI
jgi:hypothetical protein